jgi:hypothetical protein
MERQPRWLRPIGVVLLLPLVLAVTAVAAGLEALDQMTSEPNIFYVRPDGTREQAHDSGFPWLVIAGVLAAMATTAALALWAAWAKRR